VSKHRPKGIDWGSQPLGLEPDAVIAARIGVDRRTVCRARHRLGIPPMRAVDWPSLPLGQVSDAIVARMAGCSRSKVQRRRDERGIEPWGSDPLGKP